MSVPQRTFVVLERILTSKVDVHSAMQTLLSECAEERPHPDWKRLAALDYVAGAESVRVWIERALADGTPPATADGLWFGLFTPVYDDEPQADIYLHASKFDADDGDWPCIPLWEPKVRYAHSTFLRDVYRIGYQDAASGLGVDAEYPAVLGFAAIAIAAWAQTVADAPIARDKREVFVGFDGGDLLHVGRLESSLLSGRRVDHLDRRHHRSDEYCRRIQIRARCCCRMGPRPVSARPVTGSRNFTKRLFL